MSARAKHSWGPFSSQTNGAPGHYTRFDDGVDDIRVYRSVSGGIGMQWRVGHGWGGGYTAHQVSIPREEMVSLAELVVVGLDDQEAMRVIRMTALRLGERRAEAVRWLAIGLDPDQRVDAISAQWTDQQRLAAVLHLAADLDLGELVQALVEQEVVARSASPAAEGEQAS